VINVQVGERKIVERLTARRSCQRCGAIYNLLTQPPKRPGTCDACGGTLVRRSDDEEETITRRLRVYESETAPLLHFYTERGLLVTVDGDKEPGTVADDIVRFVSRGCVRKD